MGSRRWAVGAVGNVAPAHVHLGQAARGHVVQVAVGVVGGPTSGAATRAAKPVHIVHGDGSVHSRGALPGSVVGCSSTRYDRRAWGGGPEVPAPIPLAHHRARRCIQRRRSPRDGDVQPRRTPKWIGSGSTWTARTVGRASASARRAGAASATARRPAARPRASPAFAPSGSGTIDRRPDAPATVGGTGATEQGARHPSQLARRITLPQHRAGRYPKPPLPRRAAWR